jgi:hypothetical protein
LRAISQRWSFGSNWRATGSARIGSQCPFSGFTPIAVAADPAVTIYNQDFAVVRETLPLDLHAGSNTVRFSGATAHLEPDHISTRYIKRRNLTSIRRSKPERLRLVADHIWSVEEIAGLLERIEPKSTRPAPAALTAYSDVVGGDHFRAMGIALVAGRYFSESDTSDSPPVAIVDEASPGLEREPTPHVYEWSRQAGPIDDWVVRTSGDPPCATPKPHAAISGLISMEGQLEVQLPRVVSGRGC